MSINKNFTFDILITKKSVSITYKYSYVSCIQSRYDQRNTMYIVCKTKKRKKKKSNWDKLICVIGSLLNEIFLWTKNKKEANRHFVLSILYSCISILVVSKYIRSHFETRCYVTSHVIFRSMHVTIEVCIILSISNNSNQFSLI